MDTAETIKLTVKSLLEVVQTGAKNIDLAIVEGFGKVRNLTLEEIEAVVKEIETEKEADAERKRNRYIFFRCFWCEDLIIWEMIDYKQLENNRRP